MKLIDACFAWTPNNGGFTAAGYQGHFLVVSQPEQATHLQVSYSVGIQTAWRQLTHEERVHQVRELVRRIVDEDNVRRELVEQEFLKIEDWPGW